MTDDKRKAITQNFYLCPNHTCPLQNLESVKHTLQIRFLLFLKSYPFCLRPRISGSAEKAPIFPLLRFPFQNPPLVKI